MLFAQIPRNILERISAELNINLGVIGVTLKEKQNEQTRFDKVKVVSNYIENRMDVGDADKPKSYFKGRVSVRWGSGLSRYVFFVGELGRTFFVLGGSLKHVIGEQKIEEIEEPTDSFLTDMLELLHGEAVNSSAGEVEGGRPV